MKKIALIIIIVAIVCMLTACNYQLFDYNYEFTNALVKVGDEWVNVEVKSWRDYDGEQIQLILNDDTVLLVCSVNCTLYNGTLPATNGSEATTSSETWEQRVIEDACKELEVGSDGATLELVYTEYVAWLECDVHNYILTLADGSKWLVGARENEDGFYADVECQL